LERTGHIFLEVNLNEGAFLGIAEPGVMVYANFGHLCTYQFRSFALSPNLSLNMFLPAFRFLTSARFNDLDPHQSTGATCTMIRACGRTLFKCICDSHLNAMYLLSSVYFLIGQDAVA